MTNTKPLRWQACLCRTASGLYVADEAPVCETCGGSGVGYCEDRTFCYSCGACAGSGKGWHIEITPANWIGGLYAAKRSGWWYIMSLPIAAACESPAALATATPLAPPPGVCTLHEALAVLGGWAFQDRTVIRLHDYCDPKTDHHCEAFSVIYPDGPRIEYSGSATDTAPLELAMQRHKALAAYAAQEGWHG